MRIGDLFCLDFANSIQKIKHLEIDFIADFPHLLQFLLESDVITPALQISLQKDWGSFEQNRAVSAAHRFRENLRKLIKDFVQYQTLDSVPVEINEILAFQSGYSNIVKASKGFELKFQRDFTSPEHLLVPIAESAGWLICNGNWKLVKTCNNPECGLFFYDITKNHKRRWCSMQTCGNRNKVEAYLKRKHGGQVPE